MNPATIKLIKLHNTREKTNDRVLQLISEKFFEFTRTRLDSLGMTEFKGDPDATRMTSALFKDAIRSLGVHTIPGLNDLSNSIRFEFNQDTGFEAKLISYKSDNANDFEVRSKFISEELKFHGTVGENLMLSKLTSEPLGEIFFVKIDKSLLIKEK